MTSTMSWINSLRKMVPMIAGRPPERSEGTGPLAPGSRAEKELLLTVATAALMGILYGVFVQPFWSEAVEFGQVWAGLVQYEPTNPWYGTIVSAPSVQIIIPALLLLAGFDPWHLSLASTAFFCATSFSATTIAAYTYSRHWGLSLCIPLALLTYGFANSHGYPVAFPVIYWQFGQTGQYIALLALALAACGWPLAAGLFGGILAGVHAVWCAAFVIGALPIVAWLQPRQLRQLVPAFVLSVAAILLLQGFGESIMPPKLELSPPPIPAGVGDAGTKSIFALASADENLPRQLIAEAASSSTDQKSEAAAPKKRRTTYLQGHNILFSDAPSPLEAAFNFFLPEIVFAALLAIYFFAAGGAPRGDNKRFGRGCRLSAMAAIPIVTAVLFKVYEEFDPDLALLSLIDHRLPYFVMRAILPRWLNLSSLLVPILALSLLVVLAAEKRSWLAALGLAVFLVLILDKARWRWFFVPDIARGDRTDFAQIYLLLTPALVIVFKLTSHRSFGILDRGPSVIVAVALASFFVVKVKDLAVPAYAEQRYRGSDDADALVEAAKRDNGTLIIASGVYALRGFNPQLRTGRAILVPLYLNIYDQEAGRVVGVFCYTDHYLPFAEFYANIRPCFENRSPREWAVVRREARVTGLIAPADWRLRIPVAASSGDFSYYRLPTSDEAATP